MERKEISNSVLAVEDELLPDEAKMASFVSIRKFGVELFYSNCFGVPGFQESHDLRSMARKERRSKIVRDV